MIIKIGIIALTMMFFVGTTVHAATTDFTADGNITVSAVTFGSTTANALIMNGSTAESWAFSSGTFTVTNPGTFMVGSADANVDIISFILDGTVEACAANTTPGTSYTTAPTAAGTYTIELLADATCGEGGSTSTPGGGSTSTPGGSGTSTPGGGAAATVVIGDSTNVGTVFSGGKAISTYIDSAVNFSINTSNGGVNAQAHSLVITSLDMDNGQIVFTVNSESLTATLNIGETAYFDVDGDGINDLMVVFNDLVVNRADLTIKPVISMASADARLIAKEGVEGATVYYVSNGKKYVFPDQKTYFTWYPDFSGVERVGLDVLDSYADGGTMTYRAGTKLITHMNTAKVYAVEPNGVIRYIPSEEVALDLYGDSWSLLVQDVIPGYFSSSYSRGAELADTLPSGTLVKQGDDYYYIYNGTKRKFQSTDAFEKNTFNYSNVLEIQDLSNYPNGAAISDSESGL